MPTEKSYGVYSGIQASLSGYCVYRNKAGHEVNVTDAVKYSNLKEAKENCPWIKGDAVWLGELGVCVKGNFSYFNHSSFPYPQFYHSQRLLDDFLQISSSLKKKKRKQSPKAKPEGWKADLAAIREELVRKRTTSHTEQPGGRQ